MIGQLGRGFRRISVHVKHGSRMIPLIPRFENKSEALTGCGIEILGALSNGSFETVVANNAFHCGY